MVSLFPTLQCALRVAFALILGQLVTQEIFTSDPTLIGAIAVRAPGPATSILCIVLAVFSIWLILGVGTRAVALIGLGLYVGHELLIPGLDVFNSQAALGCALAAGLALPLVFFGGGRFSVVPSQSQDLA